MFIAWSYCNVWCSVRAYCWLPHHPGCCMLRSLCWYSCIELWPTANVTQHRGTKKNKQINWKFEDVGLKLRFDQKLDSMLDAAPLGWLLRVNRGTDANRFTYLWTFMSNSILQSGKQMFGMWKPWRFNVPGRNEQANEFNARYIKAVSHWNIAGPPEVVYLQS